MDVSEVQFKNWSISNSEAGSLVEGIAEVNQCITNIISTKKGTDPLRPDFGTEIFMYIDVPINIAAPSIQREILESLTIWENRISAIQVEYEFNGSGLDFFVGWAYNENRAQTKVRVIQKPAPVGSAGIGFWTIEFDFEVLT